MLYSPAVDMSSDPKVVAAQCVQGGLFEALEVRDGWLITGQQQYSGRRVAQALIEALGV